MKLTRLTIAVYVALVFASGVVLGAFGHRLYTVLPVSAGAPGGPRLSPEEFRKKYMEEMQSRLKMSDAQVEQLNVILDDTRSRFHDFDKSMEPERQKIRGEQQQKIDAVLKPDQRLEYRKMQQERQDNAKRKGRGSGGPGRGPGPGF